MMLVLLAVPLHAKSVLFVAAAVEHDVTVGVLTVTNQPLADGGSAVLRLQLALFHG
jgi:hypothetical protein